LRTRLPQRAARSLRPSPTRPSIQPAREAASSSESAPSPLARSRSRPHAAAESTVHVTPAVSRESAGADRKPAGLGGANPHPPSPPPHFVRLHLCPRADRARRPLISNERNLIMSTKVLRVKLNDRVVLFKHGLPRRALGPGRYRL